MSTVNLEDIVASESEAAKKAMGESTYNRLRRITTEVLEHAICDNTQLTKIISEEVEELIKDAKVSDKIKNMFRKCMLNTMTTTLVQQKDSAFIITGDIPAMWLRDSAGQLRAFLNLPDKTGKVFDAIGAVIKKQFKYIVIDPYANAFNIEANGNCWTDIDKSNYKSPWTWERKYELDSLCFPVELAYLYWKQSGRKDIFDATFLEGIKNILKVFETEQHHNEKSEYFFIRDNGIEQDSLCNNGKGNAVGYTGMIWSGFRPSDDACKYGYLLPSNMFAVVILKYLIEIIESNYSEEAQLIPGIRKLILEIEEGIEKYGIIDHPAFGKVYAYEVDGLGNYNLMDDAGIPGLLSLPYIKYCKAEDEVYQNTRKFALSKENPYYFEGAYGKGLGSPHTPDGYVWHIGMSIQGLTAIEQKEQQEILDMFARTDANTNLTHEGYLADNPETFTRDWFSWSNSVFCEFVFKAIGKLKI